MGIERDERERTLEQVESAKARRLQGGSDNKGIRRR